MSDESPRETILFVAVLVGTVGGGVLAIADAPDLADSAWIATTAAVLAATIASAASRLWKRKAGVDLIAMLAMGGALALGEFLAGAILAVMLTGGVSLERFAVARARRELTALLTRAPRKAYRREGEQLVPVDIDSVEVGDQLLVKSGEVVPTDGVLISPMAILDESALTGETRPVELANGALLRSGGTNAGGPFELRVTTPAAESTYAGIIRLVREAENSKAPFVRLADRYAMWFVGLSIAIAGMAWLWSHDPIRALAVLVVATPCPLILAAPAAIVAGISRAAKHGIIIKGGGPLETLARTTIVLLDKTGTVTSARPHVVAVESFANLTTDDLVRLAAGIEQVSLHPFAPAVVAEARARGLVTAFPASAEEKMGSGISGIVEDTHVALGQLRWVAPSPIPHAAARAVELRTAIEGSSAVFVAVRGVLQGALVLHDPIRAEAPRTLRDLRKLGVVRIHMVTGDHPDVAELVADAIGVDRVFAERTPEEKVDVVRQVRSEGVTAMVGDGVNDAPALALADIGIAMGARGATAASEAADVVLIADRLEGLVLAKAIAQRTQRIALESVLVGMGLSVVAMLVAAAGYLTPVAGAVLQESIDVVVILNALRALGSGGLARRPRPEEQAIERELAKAHGTLRPFVGELASLASRLESLPAIVARSELMRVRDTLEHELLPHEREEQRIAYPLIGNILKHEDPTGPLIQTHHEIHRLSRLFFRLVARLPPDGPAPEDLRDLRRALYGLHAVLTLHFAQEEEIFAMFRP